MKKQVETLHHIIKPIIGINILSDYLYRIDNQSSIDNSSSCSGEPIEQQQIEEQQQHIEEQQQQPTNHNKE